MIIVKNGHCTFKGCEMDVLDSLMVTIRVAHDYMSEHHDEEFANENITRIIKIALATDDKEEFNDCRAKYLQEMSVSLCEGCNAGCHIENSANPLASLFDFLDGIAEKADEPEEAETDDEPEIECEVTVIKAKTPEEVLAALNDISGKTQKKEGEE